MMMLTGVHCYCPSLRFIKVQHLILISCRQKGQAGWQQYRTFDYNILIRQSLLLTHSLPSLPSPMQYMTKTKLPVDACQLYTGTLAMMQSQRSPECRMV